MYKLTLGQQKAVSGMDAIQDYVKRQVVKDLTFQKRPQGKQPRISWGMTAEAHGRNIRDLLKQWKRDNQRLFRSLPEDAQQEYQKLLVNSVDLLSDANKWLDAWYAVLPESPYKHYRVALRKGLEFFIKGCDIISATIEESEDL